MAATDAKAVPRKNEAYRYYFNILDADGDPVSGAAGLDTELSLDGAAFADATNEATEIGSSGMYYIDLIAGEMNADAVAGQVKTSTTGAKTTQFIIYPVKEEERLYYKEIFAIDSAADMDIVTAGVNSPVSKRLIITGNFTVNGHETVKAPYDSLDLVAKISLATYNLNLHRQTVRGYDGIAISTGELTAIACKFEGVYFEDMDVGYSAYSKYNVFENCAFDSNCTFAYCTDSTFKNCVGLSIAQQKVLIDNRCSFIDNDEYYDISSITDFVNMSKYKKYKITGNLDFSASGNINVECDTLDFGAYQITVQDNAAARTFDIRAKTITRSGTGSCFYRNNTQTGATVVTMRDAVVQSMEIQDTASISSTTTISFQNCTVFNLSIQSNGSYLTIGSENSTFFNVQWLGSYATTMRAIITSYTGSVLLDYTFTRTEVDADINAIIAKLPTNYIMGSSVQTAKDDEIDAIKAKTDNLPSDPADASDIAAAFAVTDGKVDAVKTVADAVKLKTDNLPSDPASETSATANKTALKGEIDANETKIDTLTTNLGTVDTVVDAIKLKTDNLPAVPAEAGGKMDLIDSLKNITGASGYDRTTDSLEAIGANVAVTGADFTALERTEIKTVLGVTGTGTPDSTPSDGVLKEIQDNVDAIETDTTSIETKVDTIDTVVDGIQTDLSNGTDGLGALKTEIDANETKIDAVKVDTAAIKLKTDNLPASPAAVGSAMTLADDTITSAKFDETSAFPIKSADTGSTLIARTGADGDTLETLSDQADTIDATGKIYNVANWAEFAAAIASGIKDIRYTANITVPGTIAAHEMMELNSLVNDGNAFYFDVTAATGKILELRTHFTKDITVVRSSGTGQLSLNGGIHFGPTGPSPLNVTNPALEIQDGIVLRPMNVKIYDSQITSGEGNNTEGCGDIVNIDNIQKLLKNRQEFIFVDPNWYLVIYDDDNLTEIMRCKVEKFGGGAIDDLTGTGTPSIRNKSIV